MAQPIIKDAAKPATAMDALSMATITSEPMTTRVSTFHGRRLINREAVMNARRPPRIGDVAAFDGSFDPVSATSSRGSAISETRMERPDRTTAAMSKATSASKS